MRITGKPRAERGFSYLDVLIAVTILMVGILTFAGVLTISLTRTNSGEGYLKAKALASTTLESVLGARYIKVGANPYSFDTIRNVSGGGVFLDGRQQVYELPGPDGLFGTADDTGAALTGYARQIEIVDVNNPNRPSPPNPITERRITITIYYPDRGGEAVEVIKTGVTNY
jgi:hypothetical protein